MKNIPQNGILNCITI